MCTSSDVSLPVTVPNRPTPAKRSIPFLLENEEYVTEEEYWEPEEQGDDDEYADADEFDEEEYNDEPYEEEYIEQLPYGYDQRYADDPEPSDWGSSYDSQTIVTISIGSTQRMTVGRRCLFPTPVPFGTIFPNGLYKPLMRSSMHGVHHTSFGSVREINQNLFHDLVDMDRLSGFL